MKNRSRIALSLYPLVLATLLIGSVMAMPILSFNPQSRADYALSAVVTTTQNCAATPANFTGIACQANPQPPVSVQATDDGHCTTVGTSFCQFTPNSVTTQIGGVVVWQNFGKLNHTVAFDNLAQTFFLRAPTNSSFPYFSNTQSFTFQKSGTYTYHDTQISSMKGTVIVNDIPAPPPITRTFTATGPINWTLVGLDNEKALLSINHSIKIYNSTSTPQTLLASESGIIEDSINLQTRNESADLTRILSSLPYIFGYGYGYWYGYGYGSGPGILPAPPSLLYPVQFYPQPEVYTIWWVNGPLSMGSTVEVLTSTGSVRGSENVILAPTLGSQDAWTVGSVFKEQFSQTPPPIPPGQTYPVYFQANSSIATNLHLDYGKHSDLLLSTADNIDQLSQNGNIYPTGSILGGGGFFGFPGPFPGPFFGGGGITLNQPVTVIRTQETSLALSLSLVSTNIDLTKNANPPPNTSSSTTTPPTSNTNNSPTLNLSALQNPLVYTLTGVIITALIGSTLWLIQRGRKNRDQSPMQSPISAPGQTPVN